MLLPAPALLPTPLLLPGTLSVPREPKDGGCAR